MVLKKVKLHSEIFNTEVKFISYQNRFSFFKFNKNSLSGDIRKDFTHNLHTKTSDKFYTVKSNLLLNSEYILILRKIVFLSFCNALPRIEARSKSRKRYSKTCLKRTCSKVDTCLKRTKHFAPKYQFTGQSLIKIIYIRRTPV